MAGSNLRSPAERATVAFGELMQQGTGQSTLMDIAARLAIIIAFCCLLVLFGAVQLPKQASLESVPSVDKAQQPSSVQKKKANRAKKGKKVGCTALKQPALDAISEEESEAPGSSDLEASSLPLVQVETSDPSPVVVADASDADAEGDIIICVETVATRKGTDEPIGAAADDKVDTVCEECQKLDENCWGCSDHRVYTSSLLLMHHQMRVAIARGAPGLEAPVSLASPANAGMCTMRAA